MERMQRIAPWWWAAAAALLAYAPSLGNGFVYDDIELLERNGFFQDAGSFFSLAGDAYWTSGELTWRPFATFTHLLDSVPLGGPSPAVGHVISVVLHSIRAARPPTR